MDSKSHEEPTAPTTEPTEFHGEIDDRAKYLRIHEIPEFHPRTETYKTLSKRLETFVSWPIDHFLKPEDLAAAGFYYLGSEDMVECFYCGGSLKGWEPLDQPLEQHHQWFPKCEFLLYFQKPISGA